MRRFLCLILGLALLCASGMAEEEYDPFAEYAPYCALEGGTLTIFEGLERLGDYTGNSVYNPETEDWDYIEDPEEEAWFEEREGLWFYRDEIDFSRVLLPKSLKRIGSEAFDCFSFTEFTLPASLEKIYEGAFYLCLFDVLRIEAAVPYEQIYDALYDCSVYAYEVPEDHPLYKSVDGALFTRDGKTLLAYPNARMDEHWDVPAGVERIGKRAIQNEHLKTLSLPIGLQAVEDYAFSGCTRLQSAALPLTVKEIGTGIFDECVSLELVSLPQGLEADKDESGIWTVYYADDSIFRGDNGDTLKEKRGEEDDDYVPLYEPARLVGEEEWIAVYRESRGGQPVLYLPRGYILRSCVLKDGRCSLQEAKTYQDLGWAEAREVRVINNETLFTYDWGSARPPEEEEWDGGETDFELYGPFIEIWWNDYAQRAYLPIQEVTLFRDANGKEGNYGIVFADDPYDPIPLLLSPNGEMLEELFTGDQVKVLEEKDGWDRVSTGFAEGWVPRCQVKIITKVNEGE